MIRNRWYAILCSRELPRRGLHAVRRLGEDLVVWRCADGELGCLVDRCPHRGARLSAGAIGDDDTVQCPFHGLRFDSSGRCTLVPSMGRAAEVPPRFAASAYPLREAHGFIWLWWGERRDPLPPVRFFDDLEDGFTYAGCSDPWPVHYTRAVENQLDVVHLPFVHSSTIGRGEQTVVNGPRVRAGEDEMVVWVDNQQDRGQRPLKPDDLPEPAEPRQHLHFLMPNLWENWITPAMRVFISFTPVDEDNTMIYMRYYQRMVRLPLLRRLVTWLGLKFSVVILHQDRRVVVTQRPIRTELRMGENLVQGDLPIVTYRRMRHDALGGVRE